MSDDEYKKVVKVKGSKEFKEQSKQLLGHEQIVYERTIEMIDYTFTCIGVMDENGAIVKECGKTDTVSIWPGRRPVMCGDCAAIYKQQRNKERIAKYRKTNPQAKEKRNAYERKIRAEKKAARNE
jgi:hypothetical protein